jgi:MFS family permease
LSIAVWGVAIVAFGLSGPLWLALVALAVAGGADMVSGVYRMTIWNTTIPDHVRGRLAGIEWANVNSGPVLGDLEAGVVAALTSVRFSIVSGGVACLVGLGVMAAFMPAFLGYDSAEPSP